MIFSHPLLVVCLVKIALLFSCTAEECLWSSCEGWTRNGQTICDKYNLGEYRFTSYLDCAWGSTRVQCCKPKEYLSEDEKELFGDPAKKCKFTEGCYGRFRGGSWACGREFGKFWKPTGQINQEYCERKTEKRYKCCI